MVRYLRSVRMVGGSVMTEARRTELLRLLHIRKAELQYDLSRAKIMQAQIEREMIETEDAIQELQAMQAEDKRKGDD